MKLAMLSSASLLFVVVPTSLVAGFSSPVPAGGRVPVTVVGGTGFVGSRVCRILVEEYGADVTSVSKSGIVPDWCYDENDSGSDDWISQVKWTTADLLEDDPARIASAIGNPEAIVSCVGVVGTDPIELFNGNGRSNIAAFGAAGGNLQRAAFVSVSSEVSDLAGTNWLPDFFDGYFDGKREAEQAALDAVDGDSSRLVVVKPSFIYGGNSFGLLPPRVNYAYGSGVEELLSLGIFKFFGDITPGLIKVALRPPVSVDAVAGACAAGAMGRIPGRVLEGTKAIKAVTDEPPATGLSEALDWAKDNILDFYDWAKVEVPRAIDGIKDLQKQKSRY